MYVEHFVPGEGEEEAAPQSHLPQLLGGLVGIQAGVAQQEADYRCSHQDLSYRGCHLTFSVHFFLIKSFGLTY